MPDTYTIWTWFEYHPEATWMLVGIAFLLLDLFIAPGIGLFFGAFGAWTLGALMMSGIVETDSFWLQLAYFFLLTTAWAVVLWKPLKKWMKPGDEAYTNFVGTTATVEPGGLRKGKTGSVKWSGAIMKARIAEEAEAEEISEGDEVWVHDRDRMTLIVDTAPLQKPDDSASGDEEENT